MNDRERISRLVGAAISECSSSKLDEVRRLLVRASRALGEVPEEKKSTDRSPKPSYSGMSRDQVGSAIRAIEDMIEREKSKSNKDEGQLDLFG